MSNNHRLSSIFISIVFLIICMPLLQKVLHFFPVGTLNGIQYLEKRPKFTIQSWLTADYQTKFERWFSQKFGFKNYLLRINNQILYSCFRESSVERLIIGKQNQINQLNYILWYYKIPPYIPMPVTALEKKVQELSELQGLLQQKGKNLLILITPSKTSIYPEFIPARYQENKRYHDSDYTHFLPLLDKYQINYLDTYPLLMAEKRKNTVPLFPRGGVHWNEMGQFIAAEALIKKIEALTGKNVPHIYCDKITMDQKPVGADKDLAELLNLVEAPTDYIVPHLKVSSDRPPTDEVNPYSRLDVLFEGGSFTFGVLDTLSRSLVLNKMQFYFYYREKYVYPRNGTGGVVLDRKTIDWHNDVFKNDLIILEINQIKIDEIGYGFVQDLIRELKRI